MKHRPPPGALLNKQEAAALLHVSTKTLDRLRAQGRIEAVKIRSRVRFRPEAVAAFIRQSGVEGDGALPVTGDRGGTRKDDLEDEVERVIRAVSRIPLVY